MNCVYKIKLPKSSGGDRFIYIPATFGLISSTMEVSGGTSLEQMYQSSEADNYAGLLNFIYNQHSALTPRNIISDVLQNALENNLPIEEVVETINTLAQENASLNTFEAALSSYLREGGLGSEASLERFEKLKEGLEQEVELKYFKGISSVGILGSSSIQKEHNRVLSKISDAKGEGNGFLHRLSDFFEHVSNHDSDMYNNNMLLKNKSDISITASTVGEYTMFEDNNYESMFLGTFKRVADDLVRTTPGRVPGITKDTFKTKIVKGELIPSIFETWILEESPENKQKINTVIDFVAEKLEGGSALKENLMDLFVYLNPKIYIEESLVNAMNVDKFVETEYVFEKTFQDMQYNKFLKEVSKYGLGNSFKAPQKTSTIGIASEFEDNIVLGQDLVRIPADKGDTAVWAIPISKKVNDRGIYVVAKYNAGKEGVTKTKTFQFNEGIAIEYRKLDNSYFFSQETRGEEPVKDIVSLDIDGFVADTDLLRNIIRPGDTIETASKDGTLTKATVKHANPDHVLVGGEKSARKVQYQNIRALNSSFVNSLREQKFNPLENTVVKQGGSIASQGDYIYDKDTDTYSQILHSDIEYVYTYNPSEDTEIPHGEFKRIPRATLTDVWLGTFQNMSKVEYDKLTKNVGAVNPRELTMSQLKEFRNAREGDYLAATNKETGKKIIGKLLDKNSKKIMFLEDGDTNIAKTPKVGSLNAFSNITYYTDRVTSTLYAASIVRANSLDIKMLGKLANGKLSVTNPDNYGKLKYVMEQDRDNESLILLSNNYLNFGRFVTEDYKLKEGEIDNTTLLKNILVEEGRMQKHEDFYGEYTFEGSKTFKKNLTGLNLIPDFNRMSEAVKQKVDPLRRGVYFTVFNTAASDPVIYRIVNDFKDEVTAHYNVINSAGQTITVERVFSKAELMASQSKDQQVPPRNSITNLYLQHGNRNSKIIADAFENVEATERDLEVKNSYLQPLIAKMNSTFQPLGINVVIDEGEVYNGVRIPTLFSAGQKAKIVSDLSGESPKVSIVLNSINGDYTDLIHENLHILLTLMRYNDLDNYGLLLDRITQNAKGYKPEDLDTLPKKEEFLVNSLVAMLDGKNNFLHDNLADFMSEVEDVINNKISKGEKEFKFDVNETNTGMLTFLNTKLTDLYDIDTNDISNAFFDLSLIAAEPSFRAWMDKNDVDLQCK